MISKVYSATCFGIDAYLVEIEVDVSNGMPQMAIVGLPDQAVRESKERVRAALANSGFHLDSRKITVNLAPADIKKEGPAFDLAIALGLLASSGYLKRNELGQFLFVGELSLDGTLRRVRGTLPIAQLARRMELALVLPDASAEEASLEDGARILVAQTLSDVVRALNGEGVLEKVHHTMKPIPFLSQETSNDLDFAEVRGQFMARRAVEIAASGAHNLLFIGPPGAGKTMIAKRIPTILPSPTRPELLEIAKIHSAAGVLKHSEFSNLKRPFRSPHHTISQIGLVGGGSIPKPGEITLAHGGILFLDEFPEFRRDAIEALRAPIEDGWIVISRAKMSILFPAQFLTVCAMNPCPCGFLASSKRSCRCTMAQIQKYHQKISGPILDRIDLHVEMAAIEYQDLVSPAAGESSEQIRKRVLKARDVQMKRLGGNAQKTNATMTAKEIRRFCVLSDPAKTLLERAMKELSLSARGYHKILKIGRTIADLAESETIQAEHISEAVQYRSLDRQWWG